MQDPFCEEKKEKKIKIDFLWCMKIFVWAFDQINPSSSVYVPFLAMKAS